MLLKQCFVDILYNVGGIAQLGERLHGMQEVSGSIPLTSTNLEKTEMIYSRFFHFLIFIVKNILQIKNFRFIVKVLGRVKIIKSTNHQFDHLKESAFVLFSSIITSIYGLSDQAIIASIEPIGIVINTAAEARPKYSLMYG